MALRADDRGQVGILLVVFAALLLAIAGFVIDAGLAFGERLHLMNLADGAARAGAGAIAPDAGASGAIRLDPGQAELRARRYLEEVGCGCEAAWVEATPEVVSLRVRREQKTFLMRILGIDSLEIGASATAKPVAVVPSPSGP